MTSIADPADLTPRAAVTQGNRSRGGLAEFFRYHGVWAPGVRLFRSIGFRAKALVISAAFMVPLAVLTYCYVDDKAAAIGFSAKERVGVAYNREAIALLPALHEQRLATVKAAMGGTAPAGNPALEGVLKRVADVQARHGAELDTGKAHAELLAKLRNLAPPSAGLDKVLASYNEATAAAVALITAATDNSNLTLDPDLDTYYLMDGSLGAMVAVLEATSLLRDMSMAQAKGAPAEGDWNKNRFQQEVLGDVNDDRWHTGISKVATLHPDIDKQLQATEARKALHAFHELAEALKDPARIESEGAAALTKLAAVQVRMLEKLDELVAARVSRMESARAIVLGVLAVSLLGALYLFMSFRKVLDGGLREVAFHIDAMRDGDLTTSPRAWGNDEAASLMFTLADMQASLRRIVTQVRLASDQLVHSSSEISSASVDLSTRTEQSAANLEETASAMEQIAATVRNNTETVDEATQLAGANASAADKGGRIIGEVMETMQGINASSTRIGDIIGTIDGIAFQTNILALNAAVEAARAGEQGRGFAVVASEVRALAQRSSAAAREIKTLITTSVGQVESGVRITRQASESIGEVVSSAGRVRELLADVAVGAREQNAGVQQSARAVQELDTVTQQNAALVEQTAAAAGALKAQALSLAGEVARFKLPA